MNVLVTGASGYLGTEVCAVLSRRGVEHVPTSRSGTVGLACDLRLADSVVRLMGSVVPSVVIHCAASVPKDPAAYEDYHAASGSVLMLLHACIAAPCPVVFVSSRVAKMPSSAYSRGKAAAELLLRPQDWLVRLPGLYGAGRTSGVIYEAEQAVLRGEQPTWPDKVWPVAHVKDAAEHVVAVALGEPSGLRWPTGHEVIAAMIGADRRERARANG